jgi:hypothetical protein
MVREMRVARESNSNAYVFVYIVGFVWEGVIGSQDVCIVFERVSSK